MNQFKYLILIIAIFMMNIETTQADGPDPIYVINLDLPHEERWREIMEDKGQILKEFAYKYKQHVNISQELADQFPQYGKVHPEIGKNIEAISSLTGIDLPTLYTFNFMYDLENMGCTSVIIRQPDNKLFHARNLDYSFQQEISQLAIQAHWMRNGKIIYKSETLVGFVSLITVTKVGQFSISINYRTSDSRQNNINALIKDFYYQGIYLPQIAVDQANNFDEAVNILKNMNVSSPIYFIVSGLEGNQGVVIERNRQSVQNVYTLSESDWFLVQTNSDRSNTKIKDYRYLQAIKNIQALGQQNCTKENLLNKVMSIFPSKNTLTISTSVYSAYDGDFISRNYLLSDVQILQQQIETKEVETLSSEQMKLALFILTLFLYICF
ncbi:hypothetical protein ABPG74_000162 [Tetrahymena malaccensis]